MAHLWVHAACENAAGQPALDDWSVMPLDVDAFAISGAPAVRAPAISPDHGSVPAFPGRSARLLRGTTPDGDAWIVVGSPAVRVNGDPLDAGIRVLRDRDELRAGGSRTFFSAELLPAVVAFPGGERATFCPRCMLEIAPGSPAVRCPQCRIWHHQSDELPCWTYADRCTMCDQPTPLDAGFRWTPEDL
jgi:hypothetical protein